MNISYEQQLEAVIVAPFYYPPIQHRAVCNFFLNEKRANNIRGRFKLGKKAGMLTKMDYLYLAIIPGNDAHLVCFYYTSLKQCFFLAQRGALNALLRGGFKRKLY